jgi:hypothetical protein
VENMLKEIEPKKASDSRENIANRLREIGKMLNDKNELELYRSFFELSKTLREQKTRSSEWSSIDAKINSLLDEHVGDIRKKQFSVISDDFDRLDELIESRAFKDKKQESAWGKFIGIFSSGKKSPINKDGNFNPENLTLDELKVTEEELINEIRGIKRRMKLREDEVARYKREQDSYALEAAESDESSVRIRVNQQFLECKNKIDNNIRRLDGLGNQLKMKNSALEALKDYMEGLNTGGADTGAILMGTAVAMGNQVEREKERNEQAIAGQEIINDMLGNPSSINENLDEGFMARVEALKAKDAVSKEVTSSPELEQGKSALKKINQ